MDFRFSEGEEKFRKELRSWLDAELANRPYDGNEGSSSDSDASWNFNLEMRRKLANKGWLTMAWPEEYGGQNALNFLIFIKIKN